MKPIRILSVILLVTFLSALCLVNVKPAVAAAAENTWEIKTPISEGISGGEAAVVDGKIYVIGDTINYMYDPETDAWTAKTPMPTPRALFGIAVWQNKIYTIGGSSGFDWNLGKSIISRVNEVYDPSTDTWETKQPMPTARIQIEANAVEGQIYVISGRTDGPLSTVYLNEVYNIANDSWTTKSPIPYSVAGYQSAVCNKKIYVMGGQDDNLYDRIYSPTLITGDINLAITQIYDPSNDSWTMGAPMPNAVRYAAAGATTGALALRRIYVVGGVHPGSFVPDNIVLVYDPENNTWVYGASMPTARRSLAVAVVDDRLYAVGGYPVAAPGEPAGLDLKNNEVYTPFGYGTPDPSYVLEHYPPKISFLSPLNQTYNETNVPLLFNVDKPVNLACYSLDGKQNVTIIGNTTLTGLSNGLHSVTVYANDTYGNMGTSETLTFTISLPFPTTLVIAPIVSVAVAGLGLLLYSKKRRHAEVTGKSG
jgi:hypothetical protein